MEENLKYIFNNINNWLKFAEAKNGAIIVINSAVIFQTFQLMITSSSSNQYTIPSIFLLLFWIPSFFVALFSFLPITKITNLSRVETNVSINDNLLFYEHIAKYSTERYLNCLCSSLGEQKRDWTKFEFDCASQIIINSRITLRKFFYFKISILLDLVSALVASLWLSVNSI